MSISSTYMWQVLLNEYSIVDPCHIYSLTLSSNRWIGKWVGERGHLLIAKSDFRSVESNWFEMMVSSFHICFPWVCIKILDCLSIRIHQFSNKYVHQSNITGSCKRPYFLHNASLKQERGQWLLFVFFLTAIYHSSLQSFKKKTLTKFGASLKFGWKSQRKRFKTFEQLCILGIISTIWALFEHMVAFLKHGHVNTNEIFYLFCISAFKYHLQKKGISHAGGE